MSTGQGDGTAVRVAAVDLGSSNGRVVAGSYDGARIRLRQVHRFPVHLHQAGGALSWDVDALLAEVRAGLAAAAEPGAGLTAAAVDTWGVDHALLCADGTLAAAVRSYRDPRTRGVERTFALPLRRLWELTGIQPDPINTTHQLAAGLREDPSLRERTDSVLMLPDYVAHRLGADRGWSRAAWSTSGLCAPGATGWAGEVLEGLGLDPAWFGPLSGERTVIGEVDIEGSRLRLLRAGSHDTACAVHALPRTEGSRVFLSSGSWSLIGVELDQPRLDREVFEAGFTNELRTDGGIRLLKNLTGLWILQECQHQWAAAGEPVEDALLVAEARHAPSLGVVFDPVHPDFGLPGPMADRVAGHLREHHGRAPQSRGQLARAVMESLAVAYARAVDQLATLLGSRPGHLVVVGGGVRNDLLLEMTAAACRMPVLAGPAEASAAGSVLAQLETLGHLAGRDDAARLAGGIGPARPILPEEVDPALHALAELTPTMTRSHR